MRALLRVISGEKEEENQADNPYRNHGWLVSKKKRL
jgi:hypothetical protein